MKAIKLLLASAVLAGAASLAFAGQSPDAWTRKPAKAQPQVTAPASCTTACATACACCSGMKKA